MRQPVLAMVNGPAVGFGFELALQADIRVAGESARFGVPFGRLGTVSDTGAGSWLLPRLIGWSRAAEIFYTGRLYSAAEALAMGLVNHVVPDAELAAFTAGLAAEIAAVPGPDAQAGGAGGFGRQLCRAVPPSHEP
jgi:enoyl-CoA hydratase/carnithine racemase